MLKTMIVAVVMITAVYAHAQQGTPDDKTSTYTPPKYRTYIGTAPAAPATPYNPTLGRPAGSGSDHESKCNAGVCPN
jgi:hypothetical protein